jgi:hypothetical protein
MKESLIDLLLHGLLLVSYITALLTVAGALAEYHSYLISTTGVTTMTFWLAGFGLVCFTAAYLIATDKLPDAYTEFHSVCCGNFRDHVTHIGVSRRVTDLLLHYGGKDS